MNRRRELQDMQRPALVLAGLSSLASLLATWLGRSDTEPQLGMPLVHGLVLAAVVAALLFKPLVVPVAVTSVVLIGVAGRWIANPQGDLLWALLLMWLLLGVVFAHPLGNEAFVLAVGAAFAAPVWWQNGLSDALARASIAAVLLAVVLVVRSQLDRASQTVAAVFEHAPVGMMEQNWSDTLEELERLRRSGVTDMEAYLRANPAELGRLFSTARLVSQNAQAARVFPSPGDDGRHAPDIIREAMFEDGIRLMVDLFEGRYDRNVVWPMPDDNGAMHWHQITGFRHPAGGGDFIMVSTDITSVKKAEEALEQLVAAKDRFVASISHELRTPLAAVVGFTSELLEAPDAFGEEERREFLALANEQALEAAAIIADLLVVARADIGGVTIAHDPIDLSEEVPHTLAGHGWNFPVEGVERLPKVCADSGRVRQILRNLLTNALRYGGPSIRIVGTTAADAVAIEVRDDGPELAQDRLESLFEPYARGHAAAGITESVGLGLTVARLLASLMGGSLDAFRESGETVFRLTLPRVGACGVGDRSSVRAT